MFSPQYLSERAATSCLLARAKPELCSAVLHALPTGETISSLRDMAAKLIWQERLLAREPRKKTQFNLFQTSPQKPNRSGPARPPSEKKRPQSTKTGKPPGTRPHQSTKPEPATKAGGRPPQPQPTGSFICGESHMAKDCPLRHSHGCPACGGECPSLRSCKTSYIHRALKGPGMPSARKAEEQRPFIDLRSPTEGSEVTEAKKENAPPNTTQPPEGTSAASRDPKYVSGWRINERVAPRQDKQTQTGGTPREEATPPQPVPDDAATGATASRAEQTGGANGLSRPRHVPRTLKAAPLLFQRRQTLPKRKREVSTSKERYPLRKRVKQSPLPPVKKEDR